MPTNKVPIGAFAGVYVGITGQASALTYISADRTNGCSVSESLPTEYVISIDAPVQSGDHTVTITLEFLSTDDQVTCLARGLPLGYDVDAGPGQTQYALMLAYPGNTSDNYYFAKVRTEKTYNRQYGKTRATSTVVVFVAEAREIPIKLLVKGTLAKLQTAMGAQYPL